MSVVVRLRRIGKNPKKRPHFRITVFDKPRGRDSKFIEELGFYNPVSGAIKIKNERVDYWVRNGALLSNTVKSLIKKSGRNSASASDTTKGGKDAAGTAS